ncbi:hypothetical protein UB37_04975 [Photobacterium iliopiscarium]|nr:hypothetical protein [Photobacterium iliopiscarium]KJG24388.1 hypothetical protein UB37_04975 [Photobacterium iliopiscarium]
MNKAPIYNQNNSYKLPKDIVTGRYYIDVAMVKPNTHQPKLLLGINGKIKNKWFQLMPITIK